MTNQTTADIEVKAEDDLMFHRFLAVLLDLSKMDREEIMNIEAHLRKYVKKQDPCWVCFSHKATDAFLKCLRESADY
jgi:recombinational DNA repair protein RecR